MISRRKLLMTIAGATALSPLLYYAAVETLNDKNVTGRFPPELYDLEMGKNFLDGIFSNTNKAELIRELKSKLPWYYVIAPQIALKRAARADYYNGDVIEAGGWILPRVSALICAVAFLENQNVR